jgi:hypothetical protein
LTTNLPERKIGPQFGTNHTTVGNIKRRLGIKTRKCIEAPKYTPGQKKRAKTNCRKLYRANTHKKLVLDDECYVMADPENIPGQRYFRYIDLAEVPEELMFKPKEKFPKKYCVWQAIDEDGN